MNLLSALLFCMVFCLYASGAVSWPSICCLKKTSVRNLPVANVRDCKVQHAGLCPFDAIIIHTRKGKQLCFDPTAQWVTRNVVMKESDSCDTSKPKRNSKTKNKGKKNTKAKKKVKQQKGS